MNVNKLIFLFLLILFVLCQIAAGQVGHGTTEETIRDIRNQIRNKFDKEYLVDVYNVDSASSFSVWEVEKGITDPYNTLGGTQIFLADAIRQEDGTHPNSFLGIYESNSIIWHSDLDINSVAMVDSRLVGTFDLNNSKKVEIITKWQIGMRGDNVEIWITTWDGNSGRWINEVNDRGHSNIKLKDGTFKFIDQEGDGIKEIIGKNFELKPVLYRWNGQYYVLDREFDDIGDINVPRNNLKASVHTEISPKDEELFFNYKVTNNEVSRQEIQVFAVENRANKISNFKGPENWWKFPITDEGLMKWFTSPILDQPQKITIKAGSSDSSFSFSSAKVLPRPATYYIQGYNGNVQNRDILVNSVKGTTLGPIDYSNTYNAPVFTDSLRSYTAHACELGWIINKGTCRSLEQKLQNVKKHLEKGKTKTAGNVLRAFINQVEAQKGKKLTSEGYGLLYFNAVYLREKLEEQSGR